MKQQNGWVWKGLVLSAGILLIGGTLLLALRPRAAVPEATPLPIFSAPSHVPPGESWVILGSLEDIPEDLVAKPLSEGVAVLEVQRLSKVALGLRLQVAAGTRGKLVEVSSPGSESALALDLYLGRVVPSRTLDANFKDEDFVQGSLVVPSPDFIYGYFPQVDVSLSAVRIHNRTTGTWQSHDLALERSQAAQEKPEEVSPAFVAVDPRETLPDTDGDEIPDFDEPPEVFEPVAGQLGVALKPGENTLDLVASDDAGGSSWRTIQVFSTATEEEGGN